MQRKNFKHVPEDFQVARIVVHIVVRCISESRSESRVYLLGKCTYKWFQPSMSSHMNIQMRLLSKQFPTAR